MSDEQPAAPAFTIEKIYVKDLSIEVPNAPQVYLQREAPEIEVQLRTAATPIAEGLFEAVLTVTVTATQGEGESAQGYFLVEVAQAGIFQIRHIPDEELDPILGIACPNILFPYARETVADAVGRAGFPAMHLSPVNFEAMYQQRQAEPTGDGKIQLQ
jgi:preprotein translocase subunit SecB